MKHRKKIRKFMEFLLGVNIVLIAILILLAGKVVSTTSNGAGILDTLFNLLLVIIAVVIPIVLILSQMIVLFIDRKLIFKK